MHFALRTPGVVTAAFDLEKVLPYRNSSWYMTITITGTKLGKTGQLFNV